MAQLVEILTASDLEIVELHVQKASLEEVFLESPAPGPRPARTMMEAFLHQLRVTLRLHFRNRMALIYSYLFPTIFLLPSGCCTATKGFHWRATWASCSRSPRLAAPVSDCRRRWVTSASAGLAALRLARLRTGTLLASTRVSRYILLVLAGLCRWRWRC